MCLLPQHEHDFVHGIKMQDLMEGTEYDPVLSLLVVSRSHERNWAIIDFWVGIIMSIAIEWYELRQRIGDTEESFQS